MQPDFVRGFLWRGNQLLIVEAVPTPTPTPTASPELDLLWWPLATWKDLVQIAAIVVGGSWAYLAFVRGRQRYPRATISHTISHRRLLSGHTLLHVNILIVNPGVILLRLRRAMVRVQQVLPLPARVKEDIEGGRDPVPDGEREIDWPLLGKRESTWEQRLFEIEPGESDEVAYDFILNPSLETVEVYSYFRNAAKRWRKEIGWQLTTLYDLDTKRKEIERRVEDLTGRQEPNVPPTATKA